jgi:prolyl oligopeptidase
VWFHRLGSVNSDDRYVIGREFPRIAEIALQASRDGRYLLAEVRNGDGGEIAYHLRQPDGRWDKVAGFDDGIKQAAFGDDGRLYAMAIKDAPLGRIIAIPLATPTLAKARVIVPETDIVAENVQPTRSRLYVAYRAGGPSSVRMFDLSGKPLGELPSEPNSGIDVGARLRDNDVLIRTMSYVSPPTWLRFDARSGKLAATTLAGRYPFDMNDAVVTREFAVSKDGTRIPLSVVQRKATQRDGRNPVILYGYGGYGSACNRTIRRRRDSGSITVAFTRSPTFAAAASSASPGTKRASSRASKTFSTTSLPAWRF